MSEDNQSGFKISDRRLFNPDGTLRDDAVIDDVPSTPVGSLAASVTSEVVEDRAAETALPTPTDTFPEPYPESYPEEDVEGMTEQTLFADFLMQMASSAFIYLGLVEHPGVGFVLVRRGVLEVFVSHSAHVQELGFQKRQTILRLAEIGRAHV